MHVIRIERVGVRTFEVVEDSGMFRMIQTNNGNRIGGPGGGVTFTTLDEAAKYMDRCVMFARSADRRGGLPAGAV